MIKFKITYEKLDKISGQIEDFTENKEISTLSEFKQFLDDTLVEVTEISYNCDNCDSPQDLTGKREETCVIGDRVYCPPCQKINHIGWFEL